MTTTSDIDNRSHSPGTYQLRVAGHLDDHWSGRLDAQSLVRQSDGSTTLTVEVVDQAQLHDVLSGLRDLGVILLAITAVDVQPFPAPVLGRSLHSERLVLRPAIAADADATWEYRRLESVNEWLTGVPPTVEEYRAVFAEPQRLSTTVIVELAHHSDGRPIGDFMLRREDAWSQVEVTKQARGAQAELGWVLDPRYTGSGYASEGARELLRYCFEDLGVHRVVANCFLDNNASWRLMERVGMRREVHAVADSLHRSGQWLDSVAYAILADEWESPAGPAN
jgi:RimJ/RimL family protein N-acetyltransferase